MQIKKVEKAVCYYVEVDDEWGTYRRSEHGITWEVLMGCSWELPNPTTENELEQAFQEFKKRNESRDMLDEDGYPTEAAIEKIEKWSYTDKEGWFRFISSIWYFKDWGWKEVDELDVITNKQKRVYHLSTAGWSGNESIIQAMKKSNFLWTLTWVQSRKGGHYIFERQLT